MKIFLISLVLGSLLAQAEEPLNGEGPKLSVTTSPLFLLYPLLSVQAEYPVGVKTSVALEVGVGTRFQEEAKNSSWLADIQYRYYFIRPLRHGLYGGGNAVWVLDRIEERAYNNAGPTGYVWNNHHSLLLGPIVGYKYLHPSGFTLDLHLGPGLAWLKNRHREWHQDPYPGILIGTNLGWSF